MTSLGDQIRSEANIADRPGQLGRLQAIADHVDRLQAEVDRLREQNAEWQATATHALDVIDDLKRKESSVEALASRLERRGAYVTGWQGQAAKEIRAALRGNDD